MSDAWEEIQAVKSKRNSLREKLEKRKKERQNILGSSLASADKPEGSPGGTERGSSGVTVPAKNEEKPKVVPSASLEVRLLQVLSDMQLQLPATAGALMPGLGDVDTEIVASLLEKFATQKLITTVIRFTYTYQIKHFDFDFDFGKFSRARDYLPQE